MGAHQSKEQYSFLTCNNDYEFVIKASKELEYILEHDFGATGKGLHEKISSAQSRGELGTSSSNNASQRQLVKDMRYLATIRNKLIHERGFDAIPDRSTFQETFTRSVDELAQLLVKKKQQQGGNASSDTCAIQ
jgi:hypothetical protein